MTFTNFVYNQLFVSLPYPSTDFTDQIIIVTGANVGLGLEAARHFVRLNAKKVILAVRTLSKGEEAKTSIETSTGRKDVVEVWELDLARYASVKQFAAKAQGLPRLDAVVENAGIAVGEYEIFEDNESTITVNVVSTLLLALLLLPKLRETATKFAVTPRLTIVSSEVHAWTGFPERNEPDIFAALNGKDTADMAVRYPTSKLLEVLAVRALVPRLNKTTEPPTSAPFVVFNFLNPGFCHSSLARSASGMASVRMGLLKLFLARTAEYGSRVLVAAAGMGRESHGKYISNAVVDDEQLSPFVRSEEGKVAQEKVWGELAKKLEVIQPGILKNAGL